MGLSSGLSPISLLLWAPIGLKYLKIAKCQLLSAKKVSLKKSSIVNFVLPYGLLTDSGKSSFIGKARGSP